MENKAIWKAVGKKAVKERNTPLTSKTVNQEILMTKEYMKSWRKKKQEIFKKKLRESSSYHLNSSNLSYRKKKDRSNRIRPPTYKSKTEYPPKAPLVPLHESSKATRSISKLSPKHKPIPSPANNCSKKFPPSEMNRKNLN